MDQEMINQRIVKIWDWLGDREVFFCRDKGNVFSNCPRQMIKCIDFMAVKGRSLFLRLKDEQTCEANGMCDFMENIAGADTFEMDRDKVMEIHMFQDDGDDINIIELVKFHKQSEIGDIQILIQGGVKV
jgi:hypothetical protein